VVSGLVSGLAAWLIVQISVVRGLEEWMFDGCFFYRGERPTRAKVVLVALDETSLDDIDEPLLYLSPKLAKVIRCARREGARAVGLDVMVPEQLALLEELAEGGRGDATLVGKARDETGIVVLAQWKIRGGWRRPLPQWRGKSLAHSEPADLGFVNLTPDDDHFVRRQQLYALDGDHEGVMHFSLALLARGYGLDVEWDGRDLRVGGDRVPLDDQQMLRINFIGPAGTFPTVSFRDMLAAAETDRPSGADLKDAIVIVGVTAASQGDVHATPYANNYWRTAFTHTSGLMSGPELHANIVSTLYDRAFFRRQAWVTSLPVLLAIGALLGGAFEHLNGLRGTGTFLAASFALFLAHHFGWKWVCVETFRVANWRIEMVGMLFVGLFAFLGNFGVRWLVVRRLLRVVTGPFGGVLEAEPSLRAAGDEERVITVLFADVRGFSQFSQRQPARKVMALLNRYFDTVLPILESHGGTINQFMGDGIMVLFGAPEANAQHPAAAVAAAVAMVRRVHENRKAWAELDCPGFRIGIGIHTGPVIVGTLGSSSRLTYTAIGDTVNAAARIEPENKVLKTEILISSTTYDSLALADRSRFGCDDRPVAVELRGVGTLNLYPVQGTGERAEDGDELPSTRTGPLAPPPEVSP
jgi:adenylate cyclase